MASFFNPWRGAHAYGKAKDRAGPGYTSRFRAGEYRDMLDSERVMLSAIEKWTKYGRFPYKLILHTTILMFVIIQVCHITRVLSYPFFYFNSCFIFIEA